MFLSVLLTGKGGRGKCVSRFHVILVTGSFCFEPVSVISSRMLLVVLLFLLGCLGVVLLLLGVFCGEGDGQFLWGYNHIMVDEI